MVLDVSYSRVLGQLVLYYNCVPVMRVLIVNCQVTGIINIIIDIWMLVGLHHLDNILEDHEKEIYMPPGRPKHSITTKNKNNDILIADHLFVSTCTNISMN